MPIYEYECGKCNQRFEYMEKITAKPRETCERCGGRLERLISAAGFQLKGTGWYKTDYASSKPSESKSESSAPADKPKSDTAKKE